MKTFALVAAVAVAATTGLASVGQAVTPAPPGLVAAPAVGLTAPVGPAAGPRFVAPDGLLQLAQVDAGLVTEGSRYFRESCSGCHGAQGEGNVGPALAGNAFLESVAAIAEIVLAGTDPGHAYMPPFAAVYNDTQLVALITFVRNSWGNAFGAVPIAQVAVARAAAGGGGGGGGL